MPERLKSEILEKFKSIHAFCKAHPELKRGVVYQLVAGKYAGNWRKQADKVRMALSGCDGQEVEEASEISGAVLSETLQRIKCGNCRRLNRRECVACRDQTAREGEELFTRLFHTGNKGVKIGGTG